MDERPSRLKALVAAAAAVALTVGLAGAMAADAGAATKAPTRPYLPGGAPVRPAVKATGRVLNATLTVDGTNRTYHLYVPSSLPKGPVPLLVALHGGLGSGTQFEQNTDFDGLAQANRFLVVYPDGTPFRVGQPTHLVWNAGGCCGVAAADDENVDDVAFITGLIEHLESTYDIDPHRVFLTGHSNGALLSYAVACQDSSLVDAIAVQSGALMEPTCPVSTPVSVLEIHGTADHNIPINGGKGTNEVSGVTFPPPVDALNTFAAADKCAPRHRVADPRNKAVTIETWGSCKSNALVEWAKVAGANHAWMGHRGSPGSEVLVGQPFMGFDSSLAVWSFLAAHPRT
jgi:polyhydroxybutyrate depolymerase